MAFKRRGFGGFGMNNNRNDRRGKPAFARGSGGRNKIKYMEVDPRMLVKKAAPRVEVEYTPKNTFETFGLHESLVRNVIGRGYLKPTAIQDQIIPVIMEGSDVVGLAATGTGKTGAFLLPLLHQTLLNPQQKTIVITPTRELAQQIVDEAKIFAAGTRINYALLIGGVDIVRQIRDLRANPRIVIGTPGRIKDLSERREINLSVYSRIVLDEVDRMLDMGFVKDITYLIKCLARERQSLFFSATMSTKAREVAQTFLREPVLIQIATQQASENVDQDIVRVAGRNKVEVLHDLLNQNGFDKVLVFGRTKQGMERLSRTLLERGFAATAIHGNKSQSQRQRALNAFKNNEVRVLLATDVAARGIDIDNVTHVINYELPESYADYIHRIGRTGRADRTGVALTFID